MLASVHSTVVEHSYHIPVVRGLSQAAADSTGREKIAKNQEAS